MKNLVILLLLTLLTGSFIFVSNKKTTDVIMEFDKMRPYKGKINIFYEGLKIGYVKKMFPCPFSNKMCLEGVMDKSFLYLPENIEARLKQRKTGEKKYKDYIEIIYPDNPSHNEIYQNVKIKGKLTGGISDYFSEEFEQGELIGVKTSLLNTIDNLEKTTSILVDVSENLLSLMETSKNDIKEVSYNLKTSFKDLNSMTYKINNSIKEENLQNIFNNLENSTQNLGSTTNSINSTAEKINSSCIIENLDCAAKNLNEILNGVNSTLKKRFSGARLIFGRVSK